MVCGWCVLVKRYNQHPRLVYWDNAATTWPKPLIVQEAVRQAVVSLGGNPGRGGHRMSMAAAEMEYACRERVAAFFGLEDAGGVIFMPNCTAALNTVIHGLLDDGGRVVISDLEHNAVWRTVCALPGGRSRVDMAAWSPDEEETVENFRRAITPQTRLMVCTHASNVFGVAFPIRKLAAVAHAHAVLFCVDAAQTAGVLPIDMEADDIDYLCVAAHKGLYAPMGMGLLLCRETSRIPARIQGGTGNQSLLATQPTDLPERLESGTPNLLGIAGVDAGLRFVQSIGRDTLYAHEMALISSLYDELNVMQGVSLYTEKPTVGQASPVLSLTMDGMRSEDVARLLNEHGVAVRAGLHCAPLAHRHFGTLPDGTVRLAPSAFSTSAQVKKICKLFYQFVQKTLHTPENML